MTRAFPPITSAAFWPRRGRRWRMWDSRRLAPRVAARPPPTDRTPALRISSSLAERVTYSPLSRCPEREAEVRYVRRLEEPVVPRLIVTRGVDEGKQFELTGATITIGRHSSNAVALHD